MVTPKRGDPEPTPPADPDMAGLLSIGVRPRTRGSGLAGQLIEGFERQSEIAGFYSGQLTVLDSNKQARRFYEKAGWVAEDQQDSSSVLYRKTFRARESSATS